MKIIEEIYKRIESIHQNENKYAKLSMLINEIKQVISDNNNHLKQITSQLHDYDIHDETHCAKVFENMELLIGDNGVESLSIYELILLYFCAYLHDSAMALPKWEYTLLSAVEGTHSDYDSRHKISIKNDLKPPQSLKDILDYITKNKQDIYGDFKTASKFVFAIQSEDDFCLDLAKRTHDYELFRNKYSNELKKRKGNTAEYLNYSELIRSEFIRGTHHSRVETYINSLIVRFTESLGAVNSSQLISYLSSICRSHGEDFSFVYTLNSYIKFDDEYINIQFISSLLRLADVIHFSADRAPLSLYAEKRITDPTSMQHWKAKFQELNFKISYENQTTAITYSAFCNAPSVYYFIHDYIDVVDRELQYYHSLIQNYRISGWNKVECYNLPLCREVDRKNIIANEKVFVPERNLKFTLEQSKILELLMGVQLYKDKFLCLRELYQNSLDACRCMMAQNKLKSTHETFYINFGFGEKIIDGIVHRYLYCHDNGTGMTKEIVKKHLLRIGNSYYTSKSFMQQNTNWSMEVSPTSQFGIGILSCYMIADRIEITTKHYENNDGLLSFSLDGISERFYYIIPNDLDAESIGQHGTIVKLFLKPSCEYDIKNTIPPKICYTIFGRSNSNFEKNNKDVEQLKKSLYYLINHQIGLPKPEIKVQAHINDNKILEIIPWNKMFDYRDYTDISTQDVEALWKDYHFFDGGINPYKEVIQCREFIKDIPIMITSEDIELYTHISLPLVGIPTRNYRVFFFHKYVWKSEGRVLVDGVLVSGKSIHDLINDIDYNISNTCMFNFIGDKRPLLSIDRNAIVAISDELSMQCKELIKTLVLELVLKLNEHLIANNIPFNSEEAELCLEIIIKQYPSIALDLIKALINTDAANIMFSSLNDPSYSQTIQELLTTKELNIEHMDIREYPEIRRELIVGRMVPASSIEVSEDNVLIISEDFVAPYNEHMHYYHGESLALSTVIIRADIWKGIYEEYDLVSSLWPIVSPKLFDLSGGHGIEDIKARRSKTTPDYSNSLSGIAQLDPVMINPKFGISSTIKDVHRQRRGYVGECENIQKNYWLSELNDNGDSVRNDKKDYVLFVFISSRKLNEYEQNQLCDFIGNDDTYVKGITEGWSILFIGHEEKYIIVPGIIKRNEIYKKVPKSLRENKLDNINYYDTNESYVF